MTQVLTLEQREHRLAYLLQSALDFTFQRMSEGHRVIPFAIQVLGDGAVDYARVAGDETEMPLGEIYDQVEQRMRALADAGNLQAVALVAPIQGDERELGEGYYQAIRVHLEMPDYVRLVFQPYRVTDPDESGKGKLVLGRMVATAAEHCVFGEDAPGEGRSIFNLT